MQNIKEEIERRAGERIECRGYCTLTSAAGSWSGSVVNMSQTGALVAILQDYKLQVNENITLNIEPSSGTAAAFLGRVAHKKEHLIGLEFKLPTEDDRRKLNEFLSSTGLPRLD